MQRAKAPFPFVTVNTVGPAIMAHGSDEHKRRFLPGILAGEINFAIGYTEPEAGTDLASLRTSAVVDGDEWVINGNKVFTSGRQPGRLHLARLPHRSRGAQAPRHQHHRRAHRRARVLVDPDRHRRRHR